MTDEPNAPKEKPQIQALGAGRADLVGDECGDATKTVEELNPTPEVKEAIAKLETKPKEVGHRSGPRGENTRRLARRDEAHSCYRNPSGPAGKPADPALKKQVARFRQGISRVR